MLLPTSEGAGEGAVAGARFLLREGIGATTGGRLPFVCGVAGFDSDGSNSGGGGGEDPCACMLVYVFKGPNLDLIQDHDCPAVSNNTPS